MQTVSKLLTTLTVLLSVIMVILYHAVLAAMNANDSSIRALCEIHPLIFGCEVSYPGPISALVATYVGLVMHTLVLYGLLQPTSKIGANVKIVHVLGTIVMLLGLLYFLGIEISITHALGKQKSWVVPIDMHLLLNILIMLTSVVSLVVCLSSKSKANANA